VERRRRRGKVLGVQALFDDFTRTDPMAARHQEGSFAFLNRVATPWWSQVRACLERWFASYCADASPVKVADLRARFRSSDGRQHLGAWWELYIYWLLRSLHPDKWLGVERERVGHLTRPDFCVAAHAEAPADLWVEAVTTFSGIVESGRHAAREAYVLDTINELQSPDFRLWITFHAVGETHPRKREITEPLQAWLQNLDRDDVISACQRGQARPRHTIHARGWEIAFEAIPKGTPGVDPKDRLIGIGPASSGFVNDRAQARKAILDKAGHYEGLEGPFVVAVMPSSPFFDFEDAAGALYGSEAVEFDPERPDVDGRLVRLPDGAWSASGSGISGVLFGPGLVPWTVATTWPRLWVNPTATHSLEGAFAALPRMEVTADGFLQAIEASGPPAQLLGLDPSWPGGSDPFDI
jgi:hypothetical protein